MYLSYYPHNWAQKLILDGSFIFWQKKLNKMNYDGKLWGKTLKTWWKLGNVKKK
jgi:hypothetical protein